MRLHEFESKRDDTLTLPNLEVGDELLVGKFKNRTATIQGFDTDDHNQPIAKTDKGDQKIFKPRVKKIMPVAEARAVRYFVRFGELPEGGRSKMWTAPNAYYTSSVGTELPGISVYEVKKSRRKGKWVIQTDTLNSGSGVASVSDLLYRHFTDTTLPIYLLTGVPVRWMDLSDDDQTRFDDYWMGKGAERYDLMGSDGEPMLRDPTAVGKINVMDLICPLVGFPEDYVD